MEVRVLRYFLAAVREGSMTHAAERLRISQPTLETKLSVIWKKYQVFSPAAELLLNEMKGR